MNFQDLKVGMYFKFIYQCDQEMVVHYRDCLIYKVTESSIFFFSKYLEKIKYITHKPWHSESMPSDCHIKIEREDINRNWIFSDSTVPYIHDHANPNFNLDKVRPELIIKVGKSIHRYLIAQLGEYKGNKVISYAYRTIHAPSGIFFEDNFYKSRSDNFYLNGGNPEYDTEDRNPLILDKDTEVVDSELDPSNPLVLEVEKDLTEMNPRIHSPDSKFYRIRDYFNVIFNVYRDILDDTQRDIIQKEYHGCTIKDIEDSHAIISYDYCKSYTEASEQWPKRKAKVWLSGDTEEEKTFKLVFDSPRRYQFQEYQGQVQIDF